MEQLEQIRKELQEIKRLLEPISEYAIVMQSEKVQKINSCSGKPILTFQEVLQACRQFPQEY